MTPAGLAELSAFSAAWAAIPSRSSRRRQYLAQGGRPALGEGLGPVAGRRVAARAVCAGGAGSDAEGVAARAADLVTHAVVGELNPAGLRLDRDHAARAFPPTPDRGPHPFCAHDRARHPRGCRERPRRAPRRPRLGVGPLPQARPAAHRGRRAPRRPARRSAVLGNHGLVVGADTVAAATPCRARWSAGSTARERLPAPQAPATLPAGARPRTRSSTRSRSIPCASPVPAAAPHPDHRHLPRPRRHGLPLPAPRSPLTPASARDPAESIGPSADELAPCLMVLERVRRGRAALSHRGRGS